MPKLNNQDRNAETLLAAGYREDPNPRSSKYRVFNSPDGKRRVFLGKAGAVRSGATVAGSFPSRICEQLREAGTQ